MTVDHTCHRIFSRQADAWRCQAAPQRHRRGGAVWPRRSLWRCARRCRDRFTAAVNRAAPMPQLHCRRRACPPPSGRCTTLAERI